MPTYADLAASPWLHGADFKGRPVTLTITAVDMADFEDTKGNVEKRGTLAFKETAKKLGLNRTNRECIRMMFGPDDEASAQDLNELWTGKRVTFFPSPERNPSSGRTEPAVRVKGSPDIPEDVTFMLALPHKRPRSVTLTRTHRGGDAA